MNRYPKWMYTLLGIALLIGLVYTLPNFFGEAPAMQVSSAKATRKVDAALLGRVEDALRAAQVKADFVRIEGESIRTRFADTDTQIKARDAVASALNPDATNPDYTVALNLVSRFPQPGSATPSVLRFFWPKPMYLGLDLRGGVHILMQVDMRAVATKRAESLSGDLRALLRDKNIRSAGVSRVGDTVEAKFRDAETLSKAQSLALDQLPDLQWATGGEGSELKLVGTLKATSLRDTQQQALKQNITTIGNRINALGVSEPVIQQQGLDRIVLQLPGVQDPTKVTEILGRTATLEMRMVDDSAEAQTALAGTGPVPFGTERFVERGGRPLIVKKQVIITGDNLNNAQLGQDQNHQPAVDLSVDAKGSRIIRDVSRENVGKRMAILLFEKGKGEVVTAPVIRSELGSRFQISGAMTSVEAADTALLLRSGSLAAPVEIIEQRVVGPSLGADNIAKGFNSVLYGFAAIATFMCAYYLLFGAFSTVALAVNLLLLAAVLSMLQATLTLPGMAAIALTLGMAIDANVLVNERIREEL
ncbi:MAG TPA: protein translocase subunit SecD, partial [Burkholderiaceae bacterium]|nr:protein translocase subunit SecD [Burkholderiaceae bacterium]